MSFQEDLASGRFPLALEITPPQRHNLRVLVRRATFLGEAVTTINVIQRPGRQPSLDAAIELAGAGLEPVWHLATRGQTIEAIEAEAARAVEGGIRRALVVRGDHTAEEALGAPTMRAVIARLAERFPQLRLGATLNQYQLDNPRTLRNLLGKLDAGAQYVQAQPVFDVAAFLESADRLKQARPEVPIVPMVMPLVSSESAAAIRRRISIELPPALTAVLDAGDERAAWEYFAACLAALRESPLIAGAALMTFEMDPGPDIAGRLTRCLLPQPRGADR